MLGPDGDGTIAYPPAGVVVVAAVVKVSVKLSLYCAPETEPVKLGFAEPYARVALLAVTLSDAFATLNDACWVAAVKFPAAACETLSTTGPAPIMVKVAPLIVAGPDITE